MNGGDQGCWRPCCEMNLHKLEERKYQLGAAGQELTQLCSPHPTYAVSATVPIPMCSHHQAWRKPFQDTGLSRTHPDGLTESFWVCFHMVCSAGSREKI